MPFWSRKEAPTIQAGPEPRVAQELLFDGCRYREVFSVQVSPPQLEKLLRTALNLPGVAAQLGQITAFQSYSAREMDVLAKEIAQNQRPDLVEALPANVVGYAAYVHNPSGINMNSVLVGDATRGTLSFAQDQWMNLALFVKA